MDDKSAAAAVGLLFLPGEIIIDILSRLPVDSVLQCKRVCKTWRSIVNHDPTFQAMHTHRYMMMIKSEAVAAPYCFFIYVNQYYQFNDSSSKLHTYRLHYGEYHENNDEDDEDNPNNHKNNTTSNYVKLIDKPALEKYYPDLHYIEHNYKTIYSCNGLILIASLYCDDTSMMVFNPVTKEYVDLPPSGEEQEEFVESHGKIIPLKGLGKGHSFAATGFGYHPITKEYKIVRFKYLQDYENHDGYIYVYIYTLGRRSSSSSSSWSSRREIKVKRNSENIGFPSCSCYYFGPRGVHLNGVVHWSGVHGVLSFDLADEEFRILPLPPEVHTTEYSRQSPHGMTLCCVLGGCLCYYRRNITFNTTEIWELISKHKEAGVDEDEEKENSDDNSCSWIMKFSSSSVCTEEEDCSFVSALESGKILFHRFYGREHLHFISYDPETGNIYRHDEGKSFLDPSEDRWYWSGIIPYVKSFVSLKALGEEDAKYMCC